jgi:CubicO group peptidase (beta-lactamase class C family)
MRSQVLGLAVACSAPRAPVAPDEIAAIAHTALRDGDAVGISIAVAHGDRIDARAWGFADLEHHVPLTPRAIFPLASLSKQYWAAAVVQLAHAGRVDPDAPLADVLYTFPDHRVRLRDLLQQTSGLGVDREDEDDVRFSDVPVPAFPPGSWWRYSNRGAILSRRVVEQIAGTPWSVYLRDRIAGPLGLTATTTCGDHVPLYVHGKLSGLPDATMQRVQFVCADASDVVRFERALDRLPGIERMRTPVRVDGIDLAYGWLTRIADLEGHRAYGHTGNFDEGLSVAAFRFPADDLTIVVMMNATPRPGFRAHELLERIARAELRLPAEQVATGKPPAEVVAAIVGHYEQGTAMGVVEDRDGEPFLVVRDGDKLLWEGALAWRGGRTFGGTPEGDLRFLPATGPVRAVWVGHRFLLDGLARRVEP